MFGPRVVTVDGFESQLSTNYLGHFLLTSMLLPQLEAAGTKDQKARIVNTTSIAHIMTQYMDFEDLHCA